MAIREILLLGNENLYKVCKEISKEELSKRRQIDIKLAKFITKIWSGMIVL